METKLKLFKRYPWAFGFLNIFVISFTAPLLFGGLLIYPCRNDDEQHSYRAMGIVMIRVAKDPFSQKGLFDFLIVANLAHAIVMFIYSENSPHILFDAGTIFLMGSLPLLFYPWGMRCFLRY